MAEKAEMIERGDVLMVHTPNDLVCWLIRKITGSYWNHVAWALDFDLLIEAQGGEGVHLSPVSRYKIGDPKRTKVLRFKPDTIKEDKLTAALLMAQRAEGKKYDWWLILQLFWVYLFHERKRKEAGDWNNAWICSELIAKPLYECADLRVRAGIPVDNIVPGDFEKSPLFEEVQLCQQQE